jgi:hypothetical protein
MEKLTHVVGSETLTDQANVLMVAGEVDLETHLDYLHYAHDHESEDYSVYDVSVFEQQLTGGDLPVDERKRMMGVMAHMGTPEAYHLLEICYKEADHEMKAWISLALMECKMFLEVFCDDDEDTSRH